MIQKKKEEMEKLLEKQKKLQGEIGDLRKCKKKLLEVKKKEKTSDFEKIYTEKRFRNKSYEDLVAYILSKSKTYNKDTLNAFERSFLIEIIRNIPKKSKGRPKIVKEAELSKEEVLEINKGGIIHLRNVMDVKDYKFHVDGWYFKMQNILSVRILSLNFCL
jgi:uncharacterized protein with gpF-like domain